MVPELADANPSRDVPEPGGLDAAWLGGRRRCLGATRPRHLEGSEGASRRSQNAVLAQLPDLGVGQTYLGKQFIGVLAESRRWTANELWLLVV